MTEPTQTCRLCGRSYTIYDLRTARDETVSRAQLMMRLTEQWQETVKCMSVMAEKVRELSEAVTFLADRLREAIVEEATDGD